MKKSLIKQVEDMATKEYYYEYIISNEKTGAI